MLKPSFSNTPIMQAGGPAASAHVGRGGGAGSVAQAHRVLHPLHVLRRRLYCCHRARPGEFLGGSLPPSSSVSPPRLLSLSLSVSLCLSLSLSLSVSLCLFLFISVYLCIKMYISHPVSHLVSPPPGVPGPADLPEVPPARRPPRHRGPVPVPPHP